MSYRRNNNNKNNRSNGGNNRSGNFSSSNSRGYGGSNSGGFGSNSSNSNNSFNSSGVFGSGGNRNNTFGSSSHNSAYNGRNDSRGHGNSSRSGGYHNSTSNNKREICQFFRQGRCKFGQDCRYSHDLSLPNESSQGGSTDAPSTGPRTAAELAAQIRKDMSEKPSWPFSSYSPFGYGPTPLNLIIADVSYEELRWEAYECLKTTGNLQQHNMQVQQRVADRDRQLQTLAARTANQQEMEMLLQTSTQYMPQQSSFQSSTFGPTSSPPAAATNMAFGMPSSSGTVFGQPAGPTPSMSFGGPTAGQSSGPTIFGKPSFSNTPTSPFGSTGGPGANTSTIFGGSSGGFGPTSASPLSTSTHSPFGANPHNSSPIGNFGSSNPLGSSPFGQPVSTGPFGSTTASSNPPPFGAQAAPAFGQPSVQSSGNSSFGGLPSSPFATANLSGSGSVFGGVPGSMGAGVLPSSAVQNSTISPSSTSWGGDGFGSAAPISVTQPTVLNNQIMGSGGHFPNSATSGLSGFGNSSQNTLAATGATMSFGQNTAAPAPAVSVPKAREIVALSDEDQSKYDLEAFKAPAFEYGRIPEIAPPPELC